ncbi:FCD domain-containing protein [Paenarthrobacter sp. NPDC090520]|uniref:FCD domain-containing protein n=1 Tax=Paenarthrobacter sp. NPDC090520 TaxID=3364382 RepID=UPI0038013173
MTSPNIEMEILALTLIRESERPVGSSRLAEALNESGIHLAEATAGRFLRSLDKQGFTVIPRPKQGRVVTELGQRRLEELKGALRVQENGANLVLAASTTDLSELLDILVVRRAVESEGARLAAADATDEDLAEIARQAASHRKAVEAGSSPDRESSTTFHRSIAAATRNRILISMADLLIEPANPNLTRVLEEVSLNSKVVAEQAHDHSELAAALVNRDVELAGRLMNLHVEHLIEAVRSYLEKTASKGK